MHWKGVCEDMVLLIDNYDSFSYNLYQLIGEFNEDIKVIRNDELTVAEIEQLNPSHIILSPGAGKPEDTKVCIDVLKKVHKDVPILGVCLGHQTICEVFGMKVSYAKTLMHGKTSNIAITPKYIFEGLSNTITVARYHSLCAVKDTLVDAIEVIGTCEEGEIMAVKLKDYPVFGVQFHPESILTVDGKIMMQNFLQISK